MASVPQLQLNTARSQPDLGRKRPSAAFRETIAWQPIGDRSRQLYGGYCDSGVSIELQDFEVGQSFEWSRSFHPESLQLCLNLAGHGLIQCGEAAAHLDPSSAMFYFTGKQAIQAWRDANVRHRFITIEFSTGFLRKHLSSFDGALHPLVESIVRGNPPHIHLSEIHKLTVGQEQLGNQLPNPPVPQSARPLWYNGKLQDLMAQFFFGGRGGDELFCDRQKRLARERVDRVVALSNKNLVDSLSLAEIARHVGCSPFHLSRTFSREVGVSIPQYLRKLRMERAAELLRSGEYNVTEAALEVGYSSLSHFSQSFCQTMGCCPGLYPAKMAVPYRDSKSYKTL